MISFAPDIEEETYVTISWAINVIGKYFKKIIKRSQQKVIYPIFQKLLLDFYFWIISIKLIKVKALHILIIDIVL